MATVGLQSWGAGSCEEQGGSSEKAAAAAFWKRPLGALVNRNVRVKGARMQMREVSTASRNALNARLNFHEDKEQENGVRVFYIYISTDYPWCDKALPYQAVTPKQSHKPGLDLFCNLRLCNRNLQKRALQNNSVLLRCEVSGSCSNNSW